MSVEIKVAENWTFAELQDALHKQLVGQYLRPHRSRHGILVLCSRPKAEHGEKKKEKKKTKGEQEAERKRKRWKIKGKMRSFDEVVQMLRDEALALVASRPDIDALEVVGIDFH